MIKQIYAFCLMVCLGAIVSCSKITTPLLQKEASKEVNTNQITDIYSGYRVALVNLEKSDNKAGATTIKGTLINTGKYKIVLPLQSSYSIVVNFDHTLEENGLTLSASQIKQAILNQSIILEPGQLFSTFSTSLSTTTDTPSTETEELLATKGGNFQEYCPDLQIDTFYVSKRTKKYAEISFKIVNIGKGPAPMYGETKELEDNIAIRAYASGTENLSRGDLIIGGAYIESGLEGEAGILQPSETYAGAFRIDIKKKTRHMPYLIISVDDYQKLWECDEGNNVKNIVYR